jgi:hypothetical protein
VIRHQCAPRIWEIEVPFDLSLWKEDGLAMIRVIKVIEMIKYYHFYVVKETIIRVEEDIDMNNGSFQLMLHSQ